MKKTHITLVISIFWVTLGLAQISNTYQYYPEGWLKQSSNGINTTTFTYDEVGNMKSKITTANANLPDLITQNQNATPTTIDTGADTEVVCRVKNQGTVTTAVTSRMAYWLSTNTEKDGADVFLGASNFGVLAADGFEDLAETLTIPTNTTSGTYYILYYADDEFNIAKGKTIINVFGLSKGRVGKLYRLYYKCSDNPKSLFEICKKFDLIAPTYSKEVLMVKKNDNPYRDNENVSEKISSYIVNILLVKFSDEISKIIADKTQKLHSKEKKYTSDSAKSLNTKESFNELSEINLCMDFLYRFSNVFKTKNRKDNLIQYLERLFFAETEMGHQFPTGNHLMYGENSSMEVYNMSQLNFHIKSMLKEMEKYDTILISLHIPYEEWIEFIKSYRDKDKKIIIIYENSPVNMFTKKHNDLEHINAKELSWWQHKRSAFLFIDKNYTPVYSSYYYHGTKNQMISPIIIDNTKNKSDYKKRFLEDTFQNFLAYMIKATKTENNDLFSNKEEVNLIKDNNGNIDKEKIDIIFKKFNF